MCDIVFHVCFYQYEFVTIPERNALGVRHHDTVNKTEMILSIEEIVAMSLQHIQHIAEVDAKGQATKDCVITVPGYWTQKERQVGGAVDETCTDSVVLRD